MRTHSAAVATPFAIAIIAHTPRGPIVWRGLASREEAEQRRANELRRYPVSEVVPEALADILGLMYDDDPDVEWDADLLSSVDQILHRQGLVHGGVAMPWLASQARTWPAATALLAIVRVMDGEWSADTSQEIEQALVRGGLVPRPRPQPSPAPSRASRRARRTRSHR
jgi:hypothetical protein